MEKVTGSIPVESTNSLGYIMEIKFYIILLLIFMTGVVGMKAISTFKEIELAKLEAQTKMYKAEEGHKFKFGLTKEKE